MNIRNNLQDLQRALGLDSTAKTQGVKSRDTAAGAAISPELATDQATMSAASLHASEVSSLPEIRTDKVSAIQAQLANKSYAVESGAIAAKVISHMLGE